MVLLGKVQPEFHEGLASGLKRAAREDVSHAGQQQGPGEMGVYLTIVCDLLEVVQPRFHGRSVPRLERAVRGDESHTEE